MMAEKARTIKPAIARQWLSKHIFVARYTHAALEELLEAVLCFLCGPCAAYIMTPAEFREL
jgi:hypothetical protein